MEVRQVFPVNMQQVYNSMEILAVRSLQTMLHCSFINTFLAGTRLTAPASSFLLFSTCSRRCLSATHTIQNAHPQHHHSHHQLKLNDPTLLKQASLIAGQYLPTTLSTSTKNTFPIIDPSRNVTIHCINSATSSNINAAITAAYESFNTWRRTNPKNRSNIVRRWSELLHENISDVAKIVTAETGKPFIEAKGEVLYATEYAEWYAGEAERIGCYGGSRIVEDYENGKVKLVGKSPVGVVGVITPWNFPVAMLVRKVAAALAAGCVVVCKVAKETSTAGLAVAELARRAGVPEGVVNVVVTDEAELFGKMICEDERIKMVSFTGSVKVGKLLYALCAGNVKKISLELGGTAPFVVMDDADITKAVNGLIQNKFRNAGQTCICANNVYVHETIETEFVAHLERRMRKQLKIGDPFDPRTTTGPLISQDAVKKVDSLVRNAVEKGAQIITGGYPINSREGFYYAPTILTNVTSDSLIACTEIFGPVVAISSFQNELEIIERVNDSKYGLASYLYTRDLGRAMRMSRELEAGMVGVNTGAISDATMPFGGVKQSGIGREGGTEGIEEYVETKYTLMDYGSAP